MLKTTAITPVDYEAAIISACLRRGFPLGDQICERGQEQGNILAAARITHQPDAPDLVLEPAEAARNLDIVFAEQLSAHLVRVDSVGNYCSRQRRQTIFRRNEGRDANLIQSLPQELCIGSVARTH